ncbi:hypothetical protein PR001_g24326 [Phytophthora rubi]|uniref:Uncharacterized protein n=1 Tax=Phytophthora rubi TaxID=129364 RepID=A0A6A3ICY8_9STRA|nr:hypothetical protein PR002_g24554 [Phytophthora rubi]KAE8980260.1 hypothetical protein PR001_g24326 [Phytophthora rubi]
MAKKKTTTGSGSKQRSVKERPGSAGAGTKSSPQAKGRDDQDSAAVAHSGAAGVASAEGTSSQPGHEASPGSSPPAPTATAAQQRAAHARSVKAQKLLRRREVLELRQRQAAHARLFKRPKQATQPDN